MGDEVRADLVARRPFGWLGHRRVPWCCDYLVVWVIMVMVMVMVMLYVFGLR